MDVNMSELHDRDRKSMILVDDMSNFESKTSIFFIEKATYALK